MAPATKKCEPCDGAGTVKRERRFLSDGSPDPSDILGQSKGLCSACGGSGEVLASPPPAAGVRKGYAADMIAIAPGGAERAEGNHTFHPRTGRCMRCLAGSSSHIARSGAPCVPRRFWPEG